MVEPANVSVVVEEDGTLGVMSLRGEMDLANENHVVARAASLLQLDSIQRLVIDLAKVTFIDSFGVRALMRIYVMTQESGRSAALRNPSRIAAAVLKIAAIDKLFDKEAAPPESSDGQSPPERAG
jgi:anti-sigma B factor antagonist